MAKESPTYRILDTLSSKINGLGIPVHLLTRPKEVKESVKSFALIELPTRSQNLVHGDDGFRDEQSGVVFLFFRSKTDGTPNIAGQTTLTSNVVKLFPVKDEENGVACVKPRVLLSGSDEYGFQVTSILFDIRVNKLSSQH